MRSILLDKGLRGDAHTIASLSTDELARIEGQESKLAFRGMMFLADMIASDSTVEHLEAQGLVIRAARRSKRHH
jgi:hypothetical protein